MPREAPSSCRIGLCDVQKILRQGQARGAAVLVQGHARQQYSCRNRPCDTVVDLAMRHASLPVLSPHDEHMVKSGQDVTMVSTGLMFSTWTTTCARCHHPAVLGCVTCNKFGTRPGVRRRCFGARTHARQLLSCRNSLCDAALDLAR
ncbi:hypothetical protein HAX54_044243 [Datura stramonium]|uniref:Uncharacterized protein n=1 Tax=Datura stramonium TaxID=4076 RepID=A0ABS8W2E1_DATST|nr:hypothetical protein [Datura stramonium]